MFRSVDRVVNGRKVVGGIPGRGGQEQGELVRTFNSERPARCSLQCAAHNVEAQTGHKT